MSGHSITDRLSGLAGAVRGDALGLMLFGSVARGEEVERSDTDILQLAAEWRESYKSSGFSITVYTPESLTFAAESGSLFVLHLRTEGIVLSDPRGLLSESLAMYSSPESYQDYFVHLRSAANLLHVSQESYSRNWERCHRLAVFLLRSALFARAAARGRPAFSMPQIIKQEGEDRIEEAYSLKYLRAADYETFQACVKLVLHFTGGSFSLPPDSTDLIIAKASGTSRLTASLGRRLLGWPDAGGYGDWQRFYKPRA